MTLLTVWADDDPDTELVRTEDPEEIRVELKDLDVSFSRWQLRDMPDDAGSNEIIELYRDKVDEVTEAEGYTLVDAVRMVPSEDPEWIEKARQAREKFLTEHTHDDAEDRFFAEGAGVFYLHVNGKVYAVLCEAGDLLSVPAYTTHWFDMGTRPAFAAVRFFHDEDGWVGDFTGSRISDYFPSFDELMASR